MRLDLHVHSKYSPDAIIEPRQLAKKAKELGIVPAITDHNTFAAHRDYEALGIDFIPGEEIRTREGDLIGLYLNEVIPKNTPFLDAIDKIKEHGGISIVPHMYDSSRSVVNAPELAGKADAIEVFNARCQLKWQNEKALEFAEKYGKLHSVGGDSHFLFEFGHNWLDVPAFDRGSPKALLKAMKKGKVQGKKAPFFVRGSTLVVKAIKGIVARI